MNEPKLEDVRLYHKYFSALDDTVKETMRRAIFAYEVYGEEIKSFEDAFNKITEAFDYYYDTDDAKVFNEDMVNIALEQEID